ncbi:Abi family protein [Rhodobium gokarnense]|uniref:Abi-like protein n=1 Tax=Rhodobium gokarnense TaxID=364296 RepID=A0ABT3HEY1_9HYPH|nr:Abi family protein [Rhodobium gokarnense]MCW2308952.1 hypothetical protein [Rhodobium gokarnense]
MEKFEPHKGLEEALSTERFSRYLAWSDGDRARAIELYTLNTKLSEALYVPLQMLEVALRNRIHTVMSEAFHERWFQDDGCLLGDRQPEQLQKALTDIAEQGKEGTSGQIVAELTFGFWTGMLGANYEQLWQQNLHKIARKPDGKGLRRKDLSGPLTPIRVIRNRTAHHEPIIAWNLPKHYSNIVEITGWLSPPAAAWCSEHCRFDEVHPPDRIVLVMDN